MRLILCPQTQRQVDYDIGLVDFHKLNIFESQNTVKINLY